MATYPLSPGISAVYRMTQLLSSVDMIQSKMDPSTNPVHERVASKKKDLSMILTPATTDHSTSGLSYLCSVRNASHAQSNEEYLRHSHSVCQQYCRCYYFKTVHGAEILIYLFDDDEIS